MNTKKVFLSGNKAIAEGAIYSGCRYYYSAPKPINNEIIKYMSTRMAEVNGIFIQADNEKHAIGLTLGSAVAGGRVLTSSITEGISAMEEGFSYLCGMELPCVIANIMSGRFGLRSFEATQAGYIQAVRGGASGGHKFLVLAPHNVQEVYDLTIKAFELADKYRNPVMLLLDSNLALMNEGLNIDKDLLHPDKLPIKNWKLDGAKNREANIYKSYNEDSSKKYQDLIIKFKELEKEVLYEEFMTEDAEEIIIAFGSVARIIKEGIIKSRIIGKKIGLFRPISLNPFPKNELLKLSEKVKKITVVELNSGLMYSDVINIVGNKVEVSLLGESENLLGFRKIIEAFEKSIDVA
jgi:2-oxoglutarate ferredoxin oxidoreductase subunit alpha